MSINSSTYQLDNLKTETTDSQLLFLHEIFNAIPLPIFYKNCSGCYIGCNKAFETFFGRSRHEIIDQSIMGINPMHPKEFHEQFDKQCLDSNKPCSYEACLTDAAGNNCDVIVSKSPFFSVNGKLSGVVGTFTDITASKRNEIMMGEMQSQIIQQEKLASIGQLAAGVAHEINNPMGFITSNLNTLGKYTERLATYIAALQSTLDQYDGHSDHNELKQLRQKLKIEHINNDINELIEQSLDGANRVRRIVQDLKSFSRVDQTEKARTDLNNALETTINIAWNEIKYQATLEKEYGDIPSIICYPQQLNQVFLNLLMNAVQALEKQGNIKLRTWHDSDNVYVSVQDNGKGMPQDVKQRIFEPFFTTKGVGKGTGLGLSISADIVRKHGGHIMVDTEVGKGTIFVVGLPLRGVEEEMS